MALAITFASVWFGLANSVGPCPALQRRCPTANTYTTSVIATSAGPCPALLERRLPTANTNEKVAFIFVGLALSNIEKKMVRARSTRTTLVVTDRDQLPGPVVERRCQKWDSKLNNSKIPIMVVSYKKSGLAKNVTDNDDHG